MNDYVSSLRFRSDSREVEGSTRDLKRMERQSGRTERAAAKMGRTLGRVFAGVSVGLVARQIIRNTIEQEKATAKLNATLRSTGRFSDETSDALLRHAAALQQVTTFGDELIINAQAQLLTFTNLGNEVFPRATEAILNLSATMDQDLRTSVIAVGKALNDPVRGMDALSRAGIQFTDEQKEQSKELVRTGRLLEAQSLILRELESQFGGSARAARDTFGGAIAAAKNAVGDLLEGDTGGDGVRGATDAINDLTETLNDPAVKQGADNLAQAVATILGGIARGGAGFANFSAFLGEELAAMVNGPAFDDFDRRGLEIIELEEQLDTARRQSEAWFRAEDNIFTTRAKALENEIRLKKELLRADIEAFGAPESSGGDGGPTTVPGLDKDPLQPIVVKAEAREKELKAIQRRIARELGEIGANAAEALRQAHNDLAAEIGGPVVEAAIRLSDTMEMLQEQENALRLSGQLTIEKEQQLASARALATQSYEDRVAAIREEEAALAALLTPTEQLIEDLEFEASIVKLGNDEREKAIALRYAGAEATEAQRQRIVELIGTLQQESEAAQNLDAFRSSFSAAFADVVSDIDNAGDAIERFGDRMLNLILRRLGDQLAESLFGAFGSSEVGGTSGGGFFGNVLSSLFGGGRAHGGPVSPGQFYEVGERGPEILSSGGRNFLIPGQPGTVQPITHHNNNSTRTAVNVTITRPVTRETSVQIADEIGRRQGMAARRNR